MEQAENKAPIVNLVRELTFNFKKQLKTDFTDEVLISPEFLEAYSVLEPEENGKQYVRRKPVKVVQKLPEFLNQLPENAAATVADIVESTIASYVKDQFVDQFEPVPEFSWEKFNLWLSSRGSRTKWDFSDSQLEAASASLGKYMADASGVPEVGERMNKAAKQKFSKSSIKSQLNGFDPELCAKIKDRIVNYGAALAENDADIAEEYAPVIECWKSALDRHIQEGKEAINVSELI